MVEGGNRNFMDRAVALASENVRTGLGGPFGAVVVTGDRIVSEGTNLVTSANDPTAHAEVVAIRRACEALGTFALRGCDIYSSCEPCPMCLCAIRWARLDRIYFANTRSDAARIGFDDARMYRDLSSPPEERSVPAVRMVVEQAREAFDAWEAKADRIQY